MATIIFLCNSTSNRELPSLIKSEISSGKYHRLWWSCWNSRFIKVGDRAYLQSSGNVGKNPSGFIAAGHVIAAPKSQQLKELNSSQYSDLSEAYSDYRAGRFFVYIQIDSVVDFDCPLEQKEVKKRLKYEKIEGVNFNFGRGGARFDSKAADSLDSAWDDHSRQQHRLKKGRRLVDVFVDQGDDFKKNKEYLSAINAYEKAFKIVPNYSMAKNRIDDCKRQLQKVNPPVVPPPVVPPPPNDELSLAREKLDKENFFSFKSDIEAHQRIIVSIARRQGQSKFRQDLLKAYSSKCAITDFDAEAALEAAHIIPYIETENNHPSNGLLLRADLHTLFDLNLIAINPKTMRVHISPILKETQYKTIDGKELQLPEDEKCHPNAQFLEQRFVQCEWCKNL